MTSIRQETFCGHFSFVCLVVVFCFLEDIKGLFVELKKSNKTDPTALLLLGFFVCFGGPGLTKEIYNLSCKLIFWGEGGLNGGYAFM